MMLCDTFFLNITMWAGVPSEPLCLHTQSLATAQAKNLKYTSNTIYTSLAQIYHSCYPMPLSHKLQNACWMQKFFEMQENFLAFFIGFCYKLIISIQQTIKNKYDSMCVY
eukprot:TRINITY_DN2685_c0_g1_i4.p3 TRINITY_DN2685_c0_g1~~TRINITY_DN2685_c0_g1_i4.p3  ORF type:complete len:110 (+),score=1.15 TRINITY_DN2685_c0_g1_i4:2-331(+)